MLAYRKERGVQAPTPLAPPRSTSEFYGEMGVVQSWTVVVPLIGLPPLFLHGIEGPIIDRRRRPEDGDASVRSARDIE